MRTTPTIHRCWKDLLLWSAFALVLGACGLVKYPGQPGVVTNNYAKIDMEDLEADGLFVYEVVYDNRAGGKGIGAIVTKLYPGAKTYTSNVRSNSDGTVFRTKAQYDGAEVQMIAIPSLNQVMMSPNNKIMMMIEYDTSMDEVDDKNIAEASLFKKPAMMDVFRSGLFSRRQFLYDSIVHGKLNFNGNLSYEIVSLEMGSTKIQLSKPVMVETSLMQNAIRSHAGADAKLEWVRALESNFPKGYKGPVNFYLKGSATPLTLNLGLHSLVTAEAAGIKIIRSNSQQEIEEKYRSMMLK